jgi:hypothetical protein
MGSRGAGSRWVVAVTCLVLLACILALTIAPQAAVFPTALRVQRAATILLWLVQLVMFAVAGSPFLRFNRPVLELILRQRGPLVAPLGRLSATCAWLC